MKDELKKEYVRLRSIERLYAFQYGSSQPDLRKDESDFEREFDEMTEEEIEKEMPRLMELREKRNLRLQLESKSIEIDENRQLAEAMYKISFNGALQKLSQGASQLLFLIVSECFAVLSPKVRISFMSFRTHTICKKVEDLPSVVNELVDNDIIEIEICDGYLNIELTINEDEDEEEEE